MAFSALEYDIPFFKTISGQRGRRPFPQNKHCHMEVGKFVLKTIILLPQQSQNVSVFSTHFQVKEICSTSRLSKVSIGLGPLSITSLRAELGK